MPKSLLSVSLISFLSLTCGSGSTWESKTVEILSAILPSINLSLLSRESMLWFRTLLVTSVDSVDYCVVWLGFFWVWFGFVFLLNHQVVDVQCRSPVELLPFHLLGAGPGDCQMSQIQQAVCRVKSSDNHTCFFPVLSLSTLRRIPTSTGSRGLIVPEISSDAS